MSKKPKFFITTTISDSLPFFKGQLNVLKEIFDIHLVSSPGSHLDDMSNEYQVQGHAIPMKREIALWKDLKSLVALYRLFKRENADVVHGNTPKASLLSMIAAYFAGISVRIYYVHGLRYTSVFGLKRKILMAMERVSCALATDVIAVSDGVRKQLIQDNITKKEIQIIWNGSINGIDVEFFNRNKVKDIEIKRINSDDFVFGFIGRVVKDKGVNELIEAFVKLTENYKNVKLLMLGSFEDSDPINDYSREQIKSNKSIIYLGQQKDVKPYMKRMNTFVLPSYREGFGIVLMEAGAMELASISTNISGCNEVIINNDTGILVEKENVNELLERMIFFVKNKELIEKMGKAARKSVYNRFNQKKVWEESKLTYSKIVKKYV